MTRLRGLLSMLIGGLALLTLFQQPAMAFVPPCDSGPNFNGSGFSSLPINGGGQTYCQTAFGWSDTWFASGVQTTYSSNLDVLSGDNAPSLYYINAQGVRVGSGNAFNFISPFVDGGTLVSQPIGSAWHVVHDITVPGGGPTGTSEICLGCTIDPTTGNPVGGLLADITTTLSSGGLTEQFTFTNDTGAGITDLFFDDYFNFHANGSTPADIVCPSTTVIGGIVTTTGGTQAGCSPIVHTGTMFGSQGGSLVLPSSWDLGLATSVLADIAAGTPNGATNCGPGDCAADLLWNLGALGAGNSVTFTVDKLRAPEPASLGLLGLGLVALRLFRRRAR